MSLACARRPPFPARLRPLLCGQCGGTLTMPTPGNLLSLRAALAGILIGATAAAAGIVLGQLGSPGDPEGATPCERCDGLGYVECTFCSRWHYSSAQDGSRAPPACSSCNGSLRVRCPRCRGGGTAIPVLGRAPIPVRIEDGFNSLHRFSSRALLPLSVLARRSVRILRPQRVPVVRLAPRPLHLGPSSKTVRMFSL